MLTYANLGNEGRLGNQLWQIASTLGIGNTLRQPVSFPIWEYQSVFSVPDALFSGPLGDDVVPFATAIPPQHRPYLQLLSLWSHIERDIRVYFSPSEYAFEEVTRRYSRYLDPEDHFTSVHVRRTDAVAKQEWFKVPGMDYFGPAMELAAEDESNTTFLVFSDDISWCKENFPAQVAGCDIEFVTEVLPEPERNFRGDPLGNQTDWMELFLMTACSGHITSNSTFSWWAAWLSTNHQPITPAVWYGPRYINEIDLNNFLPPEWRRL